MPCLWFKNYQYAIRRLFKRYFESKNNEIRIFGQCEVTGKNFELIIPTEGFFVYLQGFKKIEEACQ